jgi:hypothetical protein
MMVDEKEDDKELTLEKKLTKVFKQTEKSKSRERG